MGCCGSKYDEDGPERVPFVNRDDYHTLEEVQEALRREGLESSNLIIGIDFTKSNTFNGKITFGNRCLHDMSTGRPNPYQEAIEIIGRTLEPFDDDNMIPAFGFGDSSTTDKRVFPFFPDRPCRGFKEVLERYNEITPLLILAGPTSFAPLINEAVNITKAHNAYHILVIVADGAVTNVRETTSAIVNASNYPLSIVMIGVGDGPWDLMEEFDDNLPSRRFDNFQFVKFHEVMRNAKNREANFALAALMEIPAQFKAIRQLQLL